MIWICLRSRRAFSLLEVGIAVAIIGLLAALLVPTARSTIAKARASQCLSNLRQLGTGWFAYAHDRDGRLASTAWRNASNNSANPGIRDYVGMPITTPGEEWRRNTLFTCPQLQSNPQTSTREMFHRTYGVNQLAADVYQGSEPSGLKKRLTAIRQPSRFAVAMDGIYDSARPPDDRYSIMVRNFGGTPMDQIQRPHSDSANVLFADGHVAATLKDIIIDPSPTSVFWRDPE